MTLKSYGFRSLGLVLAAVVSGCATSLPPSQAPTQVFAGTIEFQGPCDGGICQGSFAGTVSPVAPTPDGGVPVDTGPVDTGVKPDAGPLPDTGPAPGGDIIGPAGVGIYEPPQVVTAAPKTAAVSTTSIPFPAPQTTGVDPDFKTTFRRMSAGTASVYPQSQAFSGKWVLHVVPGAGYYAYDYATGARGAGGNISAPKWLPGTQTILHIDKSTGTVRVLSLDANQGAGAQSGVWAQLSGYNTFDSDQSFEDISRDGKYFALYLGKTDGSRHFVMMSVANRAPLWSISMDGLYSSGACPIGSGKTGPDWWAASPSGKYAVIQWKRDGKGRCMGTEVWDLQTGAFLRNINAEHAHGDIGYDANGNEVYVTWVNTFQWKHPVTGAVYGDNNLGGIVSIRLDGTIDPLTGTPTHPVRKLGWDTFHHASCKGPGGFCAISTLPNGPQFGGEVWLVNLTDGSANRIIHHRNNTGDYFGQTKPTVSPDGKRILLSTNWGGSGYNSVTVELK